LRGDGGQAARAPAGSGYTALAALIWSLAGIRQRQLHISLASQLAGRAVFAFAAVAFNLGKCVALLCSRNLVKTGHRPIIIANPDDLRRLALGTA
jgi:hypothetical protein